MFTKTARQELDAAIARYAEQNPDTAAKFIFATDLTIERITTNPFLFPQTYANCRYCEIVGFPYAVVFCYVEPRLRIVALAHLRRKPYFSRQA